VDNKDLLSLQAGMVKMMRGYQVGGGMDDDVDDHDGDGSGSCGGNGIVIWFCDIYSINRSQTVLS
jgi:hypothetical protein